jgi:hypothetical protein
MKVSAMSCNNDNTTCGIPIEFSDNDWADLVLEMVRKEEEEFEDKQKEIQLFHAAKKGSRLYRRILECPCEKHQWLAQDLDERRDSD